jgi:nitroreductase
VKLLEAIQARRAVRSYTPRRVEEEVVLTLLRAAVQAPSAMNAQPWLFAVVQDEGRLKRYSDGAKALLVEQAKSDAKARHYVDRLSDASFNIFYDASTLVAIGVGERSNYSEADCWLAAQNLMLAARDAGLATCPIGFAVPILNTPSVRQELQFPATGVVIAPVIVGYPAAWPSAVPRGEPRIVSFVRHAA